MDGYEASEQLEVYNQSEETNTYYCAQTADAFDENRENAKEAGMDAFPK